MLVFTVLLVEGVEVFAAYSFDIVVVFVLVLVVVTSRAARSVVMGFDCLPNCLAGGNSRAQRK